MDRLEEYRSKRHFGRTPEPEGAEATGPASRFIVQKHAARRLHYDFRLELDGVLKSWAVPKGPSLDPGERRLAVQTEDHPIEYADFEGVIPKGEYGGGTVLLWDRGEWQPKGDPHKGLAKGHLTFTLRGEKLRGTFSLLRMGKGDDDWLLVKRSDAAARPGDTLTEDEPLSVATGRTMEAIATDRDRVWDAREGEKPGRPRPEEAASLPGARKGQLPDSIAPALATLVTEAPDGDDWLHEIKLDGYRILARVEGGRVRLLSRSGKDWTERFGRVASALSGVQAGRALLDGEVVVLDEGGRSDFQALQNALTGGARDLVYFAFDLIHLDGQDLTRVPLEVRKALLESLLDRSDTGGVVRYTDHVRGRGPLFHRHACEAGLEGVVSKRASASYRRGRSREWQKVKCKRRQELVVGGYTEPKGSRAGFGALLVGAYDDAGALSFLGRVGTGFSDRTLADLTARLLQRARSTTPFADVPRDLRGRTAHWVEPELVAEVEYMDRTADGILRHPSFVGLREDKPAREVRDELAVAPDPPAKKPAPAVRVRLSSPERVLFPELGITKQKLAEYYVSVAPLMLPHLACRPLTLLRCPQGHDKACFFQKHVDRSTPKDVHRVKVRDDAEPYTMVDSVEGLVGLVQMGVLEIHAWGSRTDRIERPDILVFDLDPDVGLRAELLVEATLHMRDLLERLGLQSFLKITGGKGYHLVVPITRRHDWPEAKEFCHAVARTMVREAPGRYTATLSKAKRKGKIFVDYLRNARDATAVALYSTRAREGAPVAVPVGWDELSASLRPDGVSVSTLPQRLASLQRDPWEGFFDVRQSITVGAQRDVGAR